MTSKLAFLSTIGFLFFSCQDKKTTPQASLKASQANVKEKEVRKFDERITHDNAVTFLTTYGAENTENKVRIETDFGNIEIELYEETPLHRANFIHIVKRGFLNTTSFYRVAKGFVIQGGNSDGWEMSRLKRQIGDFQIPAEFNSKFKHHYGAVAMARLWKGNPEKKSSPWEFYIVVDPKGANHLNGEHTIIGRVTKGMDVAEKINLVEVDKSEWPVKDVYMKASVIK